jgi:hypothetical protein
MSTDLNTGKHRRLSLVDNTFIERCRAAPDTRSRARKANRTNDISGLMLYVGGCLMLLLEGEAANIDTASRAILSDEREMRMILREPISKRSS